MAFPLRLTAPEAPEMRCFRTGVRFPRGPDVVPTRGEIMATMGISWLFKRRPSDTEDVCLNLVATSTDRVTFDPEVSFGGWFDVLPQRRWVEDLAIGELHGDATAAPRVVYTAGRRGFTGAETDLAVSTLRGWHDRVRVFWDGPGEAVELVVLGTCDARGALLGERWPGAELFDELGGPFHMRTYPDHIVVTPSVVLLEGLRRTDAERAAILEDLASFFAPSLQSPQDVTKAWAFVAAIADRLTAPSPLVEELEIIRGGRVQRAGTPDVVVLSVHSQAATMLRHKRLGYALALFRFRIFEHGGAIRDWLRREFELAPVTLDQILAQLVELVAVLTDRGSHVVVVGSGRFNEEIHSFAGLPPGEAGNGVRFRELDVEVRAALAGKDATFIDVEAIAAEFGSRHTLFGAHHGGPVMQEIRAQVCAACRRRVAARPHVRDPR